MTAPTAPVTLLWGEDEFLLREAALAASGDRTPTEVDAGEWQGGELQDFATPSLFGEAERLIDHRRPLALQGRHGGARRLPRGARPRRAAGDLLSGRRTRQGPGGPPEAGEAGRHGHPGGDRPQGARALARRSRDEAGVDLQVPGARALVETLGEEPGQLVAALQQLAGAYPGQKITPQIVAQQFRGLGEQKVWDLCDRAFSKDLPGAIRSLKSIEEGGDDPLKTLGGIASRIRDLIKVRALPDRTSPAQVAKEAGLRFDWQARRYQQQARNFSMAQLLALHGRITDADRALKSGGTGDVDHAGADRRDRGDRAGYSAPTVLAALARRLLRRAAVSCGRCPCWRPCPGRGRPRGPSCLCGVGVALGDGRLDLLRGGLQRGANGLVPLVPHLVLLVPLDL